MKPLSIAKTIFYFLIALLLVGAFYWYGIDVLDYFLGLPLFFVFLISFGMVYVTLLFLTWIFARKESPDGLLQRLRVRRLTGGDWLWMAILTIFVSATYALLYPITTPWLQEHSVAAPKFWVRMMEPSPSYFMELPLKGNWWIPLLLAAFLMLKSVAEESFWRGYVMPRQELSQGKYAWLIHGFLWTAYLSYMVWNFAWMLPGALFTAYVIQQRKNTTISIFSHFLSSLPAVLVLLSRI